MNKAPRPPDADPETHAALAARVLAGETAAEDDLVRRFRPGLVAVLRARTRDPEAARELAHDTLLAVIASLREGKLRDAEKLPAFVHGVARNLLAGHFRRRAAEPPTVPLDEVDVAAPRDEAAEDRAALVRQVLEALGTDDRQVLELSLGLGLQPAEIATRLGLSPDAVRMRKMRATRRAGEILRDWLRSTPAERQT
jgi:RNA polymerase sigma-70 factor (ECF subfamily)